MHVSNAAAWPLSLVAYPKCRLSKTIIQYSLYYFLIHRVVF